MRLTMLLIVTLFSHVWVFSQQPNKDAQADLVKDLVGTIAGSKTRKSEVVLNDFREFNGKIIGVYHDHFVLQPKKKNGLLSVKIPVFTVGNIPKQTGIKIRYRDVLQLEGKRVFVSFVPNPAASPYSTWDEIGSIERGEFLQVHRTSGRKIHGVYYRSGPNSLSLMKGDEEVVIPVNEIMKVYRITGDTRSVATRILEGANRGAGVSEDWLPIRDPRACASSQGLAIGAAIGVTVYLLSSGRHERVLVFAR